MRCKRCQRNLAESPKEPVGINKNGKSVAVMVSTSEYEELQFLKEQWLKSELQKGLDDLNAGRIKDGQEVIDRQRKRITNALLLVTGETHANSKTSSTATD